MAKRPAGERSAAIGFKKLTTWKRLPIEEAEQYDLLAATNDSVAYEDCFGDEPEFVMLHEGAVHVAGPVVLDGSKAAEDAQQTIYIIDGDLTVDGALVFDQSDIMTTLWVTGKLRAARLACGSTAMLIVGGALEVAELVVTDLEDAGHFIIHGTMAAPTWADLAQGRGCIELGGAPRTRFLSDHYAGLAAGDDAGEEADEDDGEARMRRPGSLPCAPASLAFGSGFVKDGRVSWRKVVEAMRTGAPILA